MIIEYIDLSVFGNEDVHAAEAMHRFWTYQKQKAKQRYNAEVGRLKAARFSNEEAVLDWQKSDDMSLFGPPKPFSDDEMKKMEHNIEIYKKDLEETRLLYNYFMRFLFKKAHV